MLVVVEDAVGNGVNCGTEYVVESAVASGAQDCSIVLQVLKDYFDSPATYFSLAYKTRLLFSIFVSSDLPL